MALMFIDDAWKEHLRDMDDLRQQVQNAVYEQKDPLVIYKFESFDLFKEFISAVNRDVVSFLSKAHIQAASPEQIENMRKAQEAAMRERQRQMELMQKQMIAQKQAAEEMAARQKAEQERQQREAEERLMRETQESERPKLQPQTSMRVKSRNDRVSVKYLDGTVKKDVKYKTIEQDILDNKCILLEE
jgi:preprotein translocase subunit SecA